MDLRLKEEAGGNEIQQYIEAVRRGCKRLAYRTKAKEALQGEVTTKEVEHDGDKAGNVTDDGLAAMEEEAEPRTKRRREYGSLGEGYERITSEKPQQPVRTLKRPENRILERFLDIGY